jgi:hypothetical protein
MTSLFGELPDDPVPLHPDDAVLLASLPVYPAVEEMDWDIDLEARCRRLERRGLVKIHRWKNDPIAVRPSMNVGRLP